MGWRVISLTCCIGNSPLRTVQRDIAALKEREIVMFDKGGVRANREIILGFLPPAVKADDKAQMLLIEPTL